MHFHDPAAYSTRIGHRVFSGTQIENALLYVTETHHKSCNYATVLTNPKARELRVHNIELVEATAADLDALVERWYSLAKAMEPHDELNELVFADVDEVSADGFRAHFEDEEITDYLFIQADETIGFVTLREAATHPDSTRGTFES